VTSNLKKILNSSSGIYKLIIIQYDYHQSNERKKWFWLDFDIEYSLLNQVFRIEVSDSAPLYRFLKPIVIVVKIVTSCIFNGFKN